MGKGKSKYDRRLSALTLMPLCSSTSGQDFFEAEVDTLARASSESESSAGQVYAESGLDDNLSGIDLMLLTFSEQGGKSQVWAHRETAHLLSVNICQILLRLNLLVLFLCLSTKGKSTKYGLGWRRCDLSFSRSEPAIAVSHGITGIPFRQGSSSFSGPQYATNNDN